MKKIWMVWSPDRDGSRLDSFWETKEDAYKRLGEMGRHTLYQVDEFEVGRILNTYL